MHHAAASLRWWLSAGVDFPIDESPGNRFLERTESTAAIGTRNEITSAQVGSIVPSGANSASSAPDLSTLRSLIEDFDGCALKRTATKLVFADGTPGSRVMIVGEAPGGEEDRMGRPFVGRAGQLLDRMLRSIGLSRDEVYIANVVPWRPPGNRTPTTQETQACLPFIKRQIELAAPEILVCLGVSATAALLGLTSGITRVRGSWVSYRCDNGRWLRSMPMLHPAYLLRQPAQKQLAWLDWRLLASELNGTNTA